jgi:hypothetical protein
MDVLAENAKLLPTFDVGPSCCSTRPSLRGGGASAGRSRRGEQCAAAELGCEPELLLDAAAPASHDRAASAGRRRRREQQAAADL